MSEFTDRLFGPTADAIGCLCGQPAPDDVDYCTCGYQTDAVEHVVLAHRRSHPRALAAPLTADQRQYLLNTGDQYSPDFLPNVADFGDDISDADLARCTYDAWADYVGSM